MAEERELDVQLDVNEQPEQPNFPRRANVISHRGHKLLFNVTITQVPPGRKWVKIATRVFSYGPEHLSEGEHVSRTRTKWGEEPGKVFEIDPANLPIKREIVVEKFKGDDHLGQGPYEAVVTVNTSTDPPADGPLTEGEEFSIEFTSM